MIVQSELETLVFYLPSCGFSFVTPRSRCSKTKVNSQKEKVAAIQKVSALT